MWAVVRRLGWVVSGVTLAALASCASMGGSSIPARFQGGHLVDARGLSLYTFDRGRGV